MLTTKTVGQLIEELKGFNLNTPVVSAVSYGDLSNTTAAVEVGMLNTTYVTPTAYSDSGYKVVDDSSGIPVICLNWQI